eukprot:5052544-Pyramimonas_sp.AAC.1
MSRARPAKGSPSVSLDPVAGPACGGDGAEAPSLEAGPPAPCVSCRELVQLRGHGGHDGHLRRNVFLTCS